MDKQLAIVCRQLQGTRPSAKWIEIGGERTISQYLTAIGLPVITGVHCIPDIELWRRFDPEGKYEERYNRYAHVTAVLGDDGPRLENPGADHFHCVLRPQDLYEIPGLIFVISRWNLSPLHFEQLTYLEIDNLYIYQLRDRNSETGTGTE